MEKYKLNVNCSEENLRIIANTHEKVRLVNHAIKQGAEPVSWVSFKPLQENTIEWNSAFEMCTSNSESHSRSRSSFGMNTVNACNEDRVSLMTESGEVIIKDMDIPQGVLDEAKNISISYDEVKNEFYLQVE